MDMRKYSGTSFIGLEDVKEKPRQERIADIAIGKYGRPDLLFEGGRKFSVNVTNNEIMCDAYGWDSASWLGHVIELYAGELPYQGAMQAGVLVRPISKPEHYGNDAVKPAEQVRKTPNKPPSALTKAGGNDMGDATPF